jgi:protein-S-isoprenylcysteine O-methyltransferase Ste14
MNRRLVVVYLVAIPLVLALLMFLPAGSLTWPRGWLFLLVLFGMSVPAALYLWRVNPEIYEARSRIHNGTKRWDLILLAVIVPVMSTTLIVAALDDGRFHWHPVPWWVCGIGYILLIAGLMIAFWAEAVNKFFEPGVRIQTDRGHKVIDTGPYAFVRHPGYVGACLFMVSIALSLGSLWALIPAVLSCVLLMIRTRWEEQTLRAELAGYKEYTQRVRSRWIPGVW